MRRAGRDRHRLPRHLADHRRHTAPDTQKGETRASPNLAKLARGCRAYGARTKSPTARGARCVLCSGGAHPSAPLELRLVASFPRNSRASALSLPTWRIALRSRSHCWCSPSLAGFGSSCRHGEQREHRALRDRCRSATRYAFGAVQVTTSVSRYAMAAATAPASLQPSPFGATWKLRSSAASSAAPAWRG